MPKLSATTFNRAIGAAQGALLVGLPILGLALVDSIRLALIGGRGSIVDACYNIVESLFGTEGEVELTEGEEYILIGATLTLIGSAGYLIVQNAFQEEQVKEMGQVNDVDPAHSE